MRSEIQNCRRFDFAVISNRCDSESPVVEGAAIQGGGALRGWVASCASRREGEENDDDTRVCGRGGWG